MIQTLNDLKEYLEEDKKNSGYVGRPKIFGNEIWKFQISLRKYEYFYNKVKYFGGVHHPCSYDVL